MVIGITRGHGQRHQSIQGMRLPTLPFTESVYLVPFTRHNVLFVESQKFLLFFMYKVGQKSDTSRTM